MASWPSRRYERSALGAADDPQNTGSSCGAGSRRPPRIGVLTEVIGMRRTVAADPSLVATLTTVEQVMSTELIAVDPSANLMEAVGAMSAAGAGPFLCFKTAPLWASSPSATSSGRWDTPPARIWPGSHRSPSGCPEIR